MTVAVKKYSVGKPSIGKAEIRAVTDSLQNCQLTMGANVRNFEALLAAYLDVRNVVVCSSGTAALHLALIAAEIESGHEVLVPDLTYVSTANAVRYCGAHPTLVDIDPITWTINLTDAARKITDFTRAIIPVHVYGHPCNMDEVRAFAEAFNLTVIEDAAEGLGGTWNGQALGTLGTMGMYSFYGNKIITTGEGGAIATNNDELANTLKFFRGQAQAPDKRFWHEEVGYNYRLTDIQAALGIAQLDNIYGFLSERERVMGVYRQMLEDVLEFPRLAGTAPWLFTGVANVPYSDLEPQLTKRGIETRPMFVPMHRLPMYLETDDRFPVASYISDFGISLPTYPELKNNDVIDIVMNVREVIYDQANRRRSHG